MVRWSQDPTEVLLLNGAHRRRPQNQQGLSYGNNNVQINLIITLRITRLVTDNLNVAVTINKYTYKTIIATIPYQDCIINIL
jgi:hypothetical protein